MKAHLWREGWVLFEAGTGFGLANLQAVDNWPRTSSKLLDDCLEEAAAGRVPFPYDVRDGDEEDADEGSDPVPARRRRRASRESDD